MSVIPVTAQTAVRPRPSTDSGDRGRRVILVGVGAMTPLIVPLLLDRGHEIVGAVARSEDKQGRDLGDVLELGRRLGVLVTDDLEKVVSEARAEVAIVAAASLLTVMSPTFETCMNAGLNVVTLEEQSTFPWTVEPVLARHLDDVAKRNGVSLVATGAPDVFWINMVATMAGAMHRITEVRGYTYWDANKYGVAVARSLRIGESLESFERALADEGWADFIVQPVLEGIVGRLNMRAEELSHQTRALVSEDDHYSVALDTVVPAGRVIGVSHSVRATTEDGAHVEFEMVGSLFAAGETERNEWVIDGEPASVRFQTNDLPTQLVTASILVNRIADTVSAAPGLISIDQLPPVAYRPWRAAISDRTG